VTTALALIGAVGLAVGYVALGVHGRRRPRLQSGLGLLAALILVAVSLPHMYVPGIAVGAAGMAAMMFFLWREKR
jgi:hypothetical protein